MTIGHPNDCDFNQDIFDNLLFKDWQLNIIGSNMRGDLVESIVKAILPHNNCILSILSERRRTSLLEFAQRIEKEHFHSSDSKEEYLYSIAKKIQHIRREFEERRLLRKIDNLNNSVNRLIHNSRNHLISNLLDNGSSTKNNNVTANLSKERQVNQLAVDSSIWIQTLSIEFRQKIVKKILNVICPIQRAIHDLRFLHVIKYAQRIETDSYLRAKTKETYFQMIAEKVQKILFELSNKRARRQEHRDGLDQLTNNQLNGNNELRNQTKSSNQLPKKDESLLIKSSNLSSIKRIFETSIETSNQMI